MFYTFRGVDLEQLLLAVVQLPGKAEPTSLSPAPQGLGEKVQGAFDTPKISFPLRDQEVVAESQTC